MLGRKKPILIAVTGGSGSGKTLVSSNIVETEGVRSTTFSLDMFYKDCPEKTEQELRDTNYDIPFAIDWVAVYKVMDGIMQGEKVTIPKYVFGTHRRSATEITQILDPADYDTIVVEGILALTPQEMLGYFDLPIFVDADGDKRLIRRGKRDVAERGRTWPDVVKQWEDTVSPAYDTHIDPVKKLTGVIVVENNGSKEQIKMQPVYDAIKKLKAAGIVTNPFVNDSAIARLAISSGQSQFATVSPLPTEASGHLALQGAGSANEYKAPRN
jgi:uridine kinase